MERHRHVVNCIVYGVQTVIFGVILAVLLLVTLSPVEVPPVDRGHDCELDRGRYR